MHSAARIKYHSIKQYVKLAYIIKGSENSFWFISQHSINKEHCNEFFTDMKVVKPSYLHKLQAPGAHFLLHVALSIIQVSAGHIAYNISLSFSNLFPISKMFSLVRDLQRRKSHFCCFHFLFMLFNLDATFTSSFDLVLLVCTKNSL